MQSPDRRTGILLALAAAVVSGVSIWINANAVRAFGDATLYTTIKNLIAAALLVGAAVAVARRGTPSFSRPYTGGQLIGLGAVGLFGGGLAFVLFFEGLARTTPASAGFIQKTLVIWVAILAVTILRERFGAAHVAAIAILLVGQVALAGGLVMPALTNGEGLIFLATLIWSVEVIVAKKLLAGLSPLTVGAARMGIGGVALIAFSGATGHLAVLGSLNAGQWSWVLLTGVVLAFYVAIWLAALARAQATDVTAVLVFGAIITAALNAGGQVAALAPNAIGLALVASGTLGLALIAGRSRRPVGITEA